MQAVHPFLGSVRTPAAMIAIHAGRWTGDTAIDALARVCGEILAGASEQA
jgi:hypothetical protein